MTASIDHSPDSLLAIGPGLSTAEQAALARQADEEAKGACATTEVKA